LDGGPPECEVLHVVSTFFFTGAKFFCFFLWVTIVVQGVSGPYISSRCRPFGISILEVSSTFVGDTSGASLDLGLSATLDVATTTSGWQAGSSIESVRDGSAVGTGAAVRIRYDGLGFPIDEVRRCKSVSDFISCSAKSLGRVSKGLFLRESACMTRDVSEKTGISLGINGLSLAKTAREVLALFGQLSD
jgi:hypothetical protein